MTALLYHAVARCQSYNERKNKNIVFQTMLVLVADVKLSGSGIVTPRLLTTAPRFYPFGFGLKTNATTTPRKMAAAIPPAVLVTPPVTAPRRPFSATASFTPRARL